MCTIEVTPCPSLRQDTSAFGSMATSAARPSPPLLAFASPPTVLQAAMKDATYLGQLNDNLDSLVSAFFGSRVANGRAAELTALATAIYLGVTTATGGQTLGEEFTSASFL